MQNADLARRFDEVAQLLNEQNEYPYRVQAYRRAAQTLGKLRTIAPRRFTPQREAWLPVLHTARGNRHYTALFSNTVRAHQTGNTRDWVVLYYDDGKEEQQATVMTCTRGPLIRKASRTWA
jgi:hypothetical protein